jgi:hypothetical protein
MEGMAYWEKPVVVADCLGEPPVSQARVCHPTACQRRLEPSEDRLVKERFVLCWYHVGIIVRSSLTLRFMEISRNFQIWTISPRGGAVMLFTGMFCFVVLNSRQAEVMVADQGGGGQAGWERSRDKT